MLCHTPQLRDISDICIPGLWRRRGALSAGVTREKVPGRAAAEAEERRYQGETKNIHQPVFLPTRGRSEAPWSPRHQHSPSPTSTVGVGGQIWVSGVFSHYQDPSYLLWDQFGIVKLEYKMVLPSRICSAGEPSFKRSWHSLLFHLGCDAGK